MRVLLIEGLSHDEVQHWNRDDFDATVQNAYMMEGKSREDYDIVLVVDDVGDVLVGTDHVTAPGLIGDVVGKSVIV